MPIFSLRFVSYSVWKFGLVLIFLTRWNLLKRLLMAVKLYHLIILVVAAVVYQEIILSSDVISVVKLSRLLEALEYWASCLVPGGHFEKLWKVQKCDFKLRYQIFVSLLIVHMAMFLISCPLSDSAFLYVVCCISWCIVSLLYWNVICTIVFFIIYACVLHYHIVDFRWKNFLGWQNSSSSFRSDDETIFSIFKNYPIS